MSWLRSLFPLEFFTHSNRFWMLLSILKGICLVGIAIVFVVPDGFRIFMYAAAVVCFLLAFGWYKRLRNRGA